MKTMVELTHDEAQNHLAYALICETMEGAFWKAVRHIHLWRDDQGKANCPSS